MDIKIENAIRNKKIFTELNLCDLASCDVSSGKIITEKFFRFFKYLKINIKFQFIKSMQS